MAPMLTLSLPFRAVVDPWAAMRRALDERRWVGVLVLFMLVTAVAGAVLATKIDLGQVVIGQMAMKGELAKASEREISDAVAQAGRVAIVAAVAKGLFLVPLFVLLVTVLLRFIAWLTGLTTSFSQLFVVSVLGIGTPGVVSGLMLLAAALRQNVLSPRAASELLPSSLSNWLPHLHGPALRALSAVEFFSLWSVLLIGIGFALATKVKVWRGLVTTALVYCLLAGAIVVGIPGLGGDGEAGGREGRPGGGLGIGGRQRGGRP